MLRTVLDAAREPLKDSSRHRWDSEKFGGVFGNSGEGVEKAVPLVAVAVPSAEVVDAGEGRGGELLAEGGGVGELLEAEGEGVGVAVGEDEAFDSVGEEVFGAGGSGGDDGASAGHGLALDEGEALLDAGKDEDVAARHEAGELGLGN